MKKKQNCIVVVIGLNLAAYPGVFALSRNVQFHSKGKREEKKIKEANSRVRSSAFYMAQNLVHSWGSL